MSYLYPSYLTAPHVRFTPSMLLVKGQCIPAVFVDHFLELPGSTKHLYRLA